MRRTISLGVALGDSFGVHPGAWRMPHADPGAYTDVGVQVRAAQAAERGGVDFAFLPDRVFLRDDLGAGPPTFSMEPLMALTAVARETERIGLVPSASTSFSEPYALARQLRALDVISHGRAGWNAVPSYEPEAFANHGRPIPSREGKYERLHEAVQIVQALWGSWEREAGDPDPASGTFADMSRIRPIDLHGRHVGSRGPLQIPPSPQGQPVVFMPAAGGPSIQAAGMYAGAVIGMPNTIEDGHAQRDMVRRSAIAVGRDPEEILFFAFIGFGLGVTHESALERRRTLEDRTDPMPRLAQLSVMLGVHIDPAAADRPLPAEQLEQALALAHEGFSPRDILAHGVLDSNPGLVGTPEAAAHLMQEWFEAEAVDGFVLVIDDLHDGIDAFADLVSPILRERGLLRADDGPTTLRGRLGLPEQLGPDPRIRGAGS
ncbi:NtaA/DmoA family FMN-dependent monooxygenase [Nocardiopsis sp. NPDC006198]|uniref:NtaA/DmoA family FMN-dependent monooxygenase n=1 Tax=Nocardiopsis sp. NPDC006198 TaxID=3154472 RepID=UPI0033A7416D